MNKLLTEDINFTECFHEEKPVFLFKINVAGLSRQRAEEQIAQLIEGYKSNNANFWFLPLNGNDNGSSNIECIWGGSKKDESEYMSRMLEKTLDFDNKLMEKIISTGKFDETQIQELKMVLRQEKLKILIGED